MISWIVSLDPAHRSGASAKHSGHKQLLSAIKNFEAGNIVDLGRGLYKVRVARSHQGKSSGYRTLVIYKKKDLALFVYGFAKNEKDNISPTELSFFRKQAKHILSFNRSQIVQAIACGEFVELENGK